MIKQKHDKDYLNKVYETPDPWGFGTNPDDLVRRDTIMEYLSQYPRFKRALDIGCGEGFITHKLPADKIYGFDLSDKALSRLPSNVIPVHENEITGKYDLIIATGVIYAFYDYQWMLDTIDQHACYIVLTCNLTTNEMTEIETLKNQIFMDEFNYFSHHQQRERLRIYDYAHCS